VGLFVRRYVRRAIGQRVNLRLTPEIRFIYDDTEEVRRRVGRQGRRTLRGSLLAACGLARAEAGQALLRAARPELGLALGWAAQEADLVARVIGREELERYRSEIEVRSPLRLCRTATVVQSSFCVSLSLFVGCAS
jgi:hypothetical protein